MQEKIMVVEDEIYQAEVLTGFLQLNKYEAVWVKGVQEAQEQLQHQIVDLVLSDFRLNDGNGEAVLDWLKKENKTVPFILMTAFGNIDLAVRMMQKGAFTFLEKPINLSSLLANVKKAIQQKNLLQENILLKENLKKYGEQEIVYHSRIMHEITELAYKAAKTNTTILITGDSGTGKELIARFIHQNSERYVKPLVIVNCAALSPTLLESELFGHVKGSFTGADTTRIGRFEQAHQGTLFLDEIGEIAPELQIKLLRVLQEKIIEKVGSNKSTRVDIRLLTATNKNLLDLISKGIFREDLYYRLNVFEIHLPPLRERKEDIPEIVTAFISRYNREHNAKIEGIIPEALDKLLDYDFPGNIRELENIIQRAFIVSNGSYLTAGDIFIQSRSSHESDSYTFNQHVSLNTKIETIEKNEIIKALAQSHGNQTQAALHLELSERVLRYKIGKYSISAQGFK